MPLLSLTASLRFEGRIVLSVLFLRSRFLFHWTEIYKKILSGISRPSHIVGIISFRTTRQLTDPSAGAPLLANTGCFTVTELQKVEDLSLQPFVAESGL